MSMPRSDEKTLASMNCRGMFSLQYYFRSSTHSRAHHSLNENQFLKFISYFRGSILYVMEIAVILSAGLRDWIDFGVIVRSIPVVNIMVFNI